MPDDSEDGRLFADAERGFGEPIRRRDPAPALLALKNPDGSVKKSISGNE
ncbi:MAG: hypothetical protein IV100_21270 [Myxococcales bacterium]|nr:hypothetical protein [Myxococcales bacterium]